MVITYDEILKVLRKNFCDAMQDPGYPDAKKNDIELYCNGMYDRVDALRLTVNRMTGTAAEIATRMERVVRAPERVSSCGELQGLGYELDTLCAAVNWHMSDVKRFARMLRQAGFGKLLMDSNDNPIKFTF